MSPAIGQPDTRSALLSGMAQQSIDVSPGQVDALVAYISLLSRWNRAYNLTAVRDPLDMVHRHVLDSLALLPLLPDHAENLIDVGTGAGLPGVPLAVLTSSRQFDLLDSNGKKARFLFQVKTELGLSNMTVCHSRADAWQPAKPYDVVLSRAFTSLADMVADCAHLVQPGGLYLAMKGRRPDAEIRALPASVRVIAVHRLEIPGLPEERHAVVLRREGEARNGARNGESS